MKILIATESYWPNHDGGSVAIRSLVHDLGDRGHEIRIVTPSADGTERVERDGRSEIHRLRSVGAPGGTRIARFPSKPVQDLVEGFSPDVVHGFSRRFTGAAAQKAAAAQHIPYVASYQYLPSSTVGDVGMLKWLEPNQIKRDLSFLNRANFVTSPTQTGVDYLTTRGLAVPHEVVPNGIDLERFQPGPAADSVRRTFRLPKKPIVLYVGRLAPEKRLDVWLEAAAQIRQEMDVHFLIAGDGPELRALKQSAVKLGIGRNVTFAGAVDDETLPNLYRLATVFAISSPVELQSLATLEAMASGLPVVAADALALSELCRSGRNGYLFPDGDVHGLAQAVLRILQKPAMGVQMGAESRKAAETYDRRNAPAKYEKIYAHVTRTQTP